MKSITLVAAALAVLVLGGVVSSQSQTNQRDQDIFRHLELFGTVFEQVRANYVDEVDVKAMIESAVNGMLTSLDPHSGYLDEKTFRDMQVQTRGEFGGLGIEVTMENGLVKVMSPIDDTPAWRAGIQPGDLIIQLDDTQVRGLTLQQAVDLMRGPVGSTITLTIRRGDQPPFEVTLTRDRIRITPVRARLEEGNLGYIRITTFNEQTTRSLKTAYERLERESEGKLKGLLLDLRNNPGGLLNESITVADAFLERGEIVSTRGRTPDQAQRWNARPGDITNGIPIVVLINGGSASASEIVAGALQDHRRALVLGTESFGKGSVQTIIPVAGHGAIRLTTQLYYTPSGRSIQAKGIVPDMVVEQLRLTAQPDERLRRERDLRGAIDNDTPARPMPEPGVDTEVEDYQLLRAIGVLQGIALFQSRAD